MWCFAFLVDVVGELQSEKCQGRVLFLDGREGEANVSLNNASKSTRLSRRVLFLYYLSSFRSLYLWFNYGEEALQVQLSS